MKKFFALLILISLCLTPFITSCSKGKDNTTTKTPESTTEDKNSTSQNETQSNDNTTTAESKSTEGTSSQNSESSSTEDTTEFDPAKYNYKNTKWDGKTLKILAIGNSFSEDAMTYLFNIAKAEGVENIILGNLYIGGCTLATHADNAQNNKANYSYFKNTSGSWTERKSTTMLDGIKDENWDVITLQQASGYSGVPDSYSQHLDYLIEYVNKNKLNKEAQLVWHMTWAYQSDSNHEDFPKYSKNQMLMYNKIISTVKNVVLPQKAFNILIPAGTVIQNARTSYFGDKLTRDGYHLNELARYIVGYTWYATLTGRELSEIKYKPNNLSLNDSDIEVILESINNAGEKLFSVTESEHTEKPSFDFSNYTELEFEYTVGGYWNSTDSNRYAEVITSADNSKYFIATEMFTKDSLPVGSVIVVDEGWQYRPERWTSLIKQTTRENPVTQNIFIVTEDWWNGYTYRAFNISVVGANRDIRGEQDAISHFKLYVPKG